MSIPERDFHHGLLGGTCDGLARAEVCHDTVVDLAGEEAFETPDDLASGPTVRGPSRDVVEGRLVVPHADDDGAIEGRIGLSVPAPIEAVPAGGDPRRSGDGTRATEFRKGAFRANPVGVIAGGRAVGVLQSANLRRRPVTLFASHSPRESRRWAQSASSLGKWRARQDSNLRPSAEKADALSS